MKSSVWYHALLAVGFCLALAAIGYNAASAPDFRFPVPVLQPYELPAAPTAGLRDTAAAGGAVKVNINSATAAELESLPGVGAKTAQKIVEYRQAHGRFRSRKELMEVPGIGEKTYERFKDLVLI